MATEGVYIHQCLQKLEQMACPKLVLNRYLLRRVSCCKFPSPLLFKFYASQSVSFIGGDSASTGELPPSTESPELPNWVKFFEHHPAALTATESDDDFVLPKIAEWADTQKLYDSHRSEAKRLVREIVDGDVEMVCRVLKGRFSSPKDAVSALESGTGVVNLSEAFVEKVIRRFSYEWIPALGFFTWAKAQTGYVQSANCYDLMVDILAKCRKFGMVEELMEEMKGDGLVSIVTISKVIRRLGRAGKCEDAIELFRGIEERFGIKREVSGLTILMDALVKADGVENAQKVFDEFVDEITPDMNTFNVLIHGYCKARQLERAKEAMEVMKKHGFHPDVVSYTCFIEAYCRDKDFQNVDRVMDEMQQNGCSPSVVTYTIIMHALGKAKETNEALKVYEKMKQNKCAPDAHFCSSLIFILYKSGRYKDARKVFDGMEALNVTPDVVTYNTMITAACAHSHEEEALGFLMEMEKKGCEPNVETYAPLLKICCRKKWMKVMKILLNDMFRKGVSIDLGAYALLVIALCKSEKLELACCFFEECVSKGMIPKESAYKMLVKKLEEKGMEKAKQEIERMMSLVRPTPITTYKEGMPHIPVSESVIP